MTKKQLTYVLSIFIGTLILLCNTSCSSKEDTSITEQEPLPVMDTVTYLPEASGESVAESDYVCIDYSNSDQGYIMVKYLGSHTGKVKFQITGPTGLTYTYNLTQGADFQTFPLTSGSGEYTLNTFEQDTGTSYYTVDSETISFTIADDFLPYLYPNQFVNYTPESSVVDLSIAAATDVYSEIDLITSIYYEVMTTLEYDQAQAESISSGSLTDYVPDLDNVITNQKGICFDYAALMVAMLRIQNMPAKLVIGYAGEAYHAWINVYTIEDGWINEAIYFDGENWNLMDPTFADNAENDSTINNFIGDGTNYTEKYIY